MLGLLHGRQFCGQSISLGIGLSEFSYQLLIDFLQLVDFLVALSLHTGELSDGAVQVIHFGSDELLSPFLGVMAEDEAVGIGIDKSAAQHLKLADFGGSLRDGILCRGHGEAIQDSLHRCYLDVPILQ